MRPAQQKFESPRDREIVPEIPNRGGWNVILSQSARNGNGEIAKCKPRGSGTTERNQETLNLSAESLRGPIRGTSNGKIGQQLAPNSDRFAHHKGM